MNKLYVDHVLTFIDDLFQSFHGLVEANHDQINLKWITNPNIGINHLGSRQHVWAWHKNLEIRVVTFVTQKIYPTIMDGVKLQASIVVVQLINELEMQFPSQELMDALGVVYPLYVVVVR